VKKERDCRSVPILYLALGLMAKGSIPSQVRKILQ